MHCGSIVRGRYGKKTDICDINNKRERFMFDNAYVISKNKNIRTIIYRFFKN
jgi:hypothetical protein